jgi:FHA domain/Double zinc ribbon
MNASLRCPDGHVTQATDYCDVCGLPMSLSAMPPDGPGPGVGPGPGYGPGNGRPQVPPPPAEKDCPNCGYIVPATDLFCENCGYDFTTGQLPIDPAAMMPHGQQPGYGQGYGPGPDPGYAPGYGPGYGQQPGAQYPPDRGPGYGADPAPVYAPDQGPGYGPDQGYDHGPDQGYSHGPDQGYSHGPDQGYSHGPDQGYSHGPDQGPGYGPDQVPPAQTPSASLPPPLLAPAPDYPGPAQPGPGQPGPGQPGPGQSPAGPQVSGLLGPNGQAGPRPGQAGPVVWVAELWVDPDWFATQESDEVCPSSGMPIIIPLLDRSLLIGRVSVSRSIHPQIDCGTDHGVSRRHAQLTSDGQRWWIEDLQSSNGTFVGPAGAPLPTIPIRPGQRTEFAAGDRIYVGAWSRIVVRRPTPDEA